MQVRRVQVERGLRQRKRVGTLAAWLWSLYALFIGDAGMNDMRMAFDVIPNPGEGADQIYLETAGIVTTFLLAGRWFEKRAGDGNGRTATGGTTGSGAAAPAGTVDTTTSAESTGQASSHGSSLSSRQALPSIAVVALNVASRSRSVTAQPHSYKHTYGSSNATG